MIFAHLTQGNGEPLFIFGLSDENIQRLQQGQPITFDMRERAGTDNVPPGRVVICWGRTEEAIAAEWQHAFSADTYIKDHRK